MEWQDDPAIAHDQVKLGAELCIHHPTWADEISVPNKSTLENIQEILNEKISQHPNNC
jgi:DNA polymerase-1